MAERLPDVLARYRELTRQMADPEVAANPARYKEVLKEHGRLKGRALRYEAWQEASKRVAEAREYAAGEDEDLAELAREELAAHEQELAEQTEELALEMGADEADEARSVIMEIRPGTGGDEAALFARDLCEMYRRFAEIHRLRFEVLAMHETDLGGVREAILSLSGPGVYRNLKFESGGHRVQRVPKTETQGRVHTSAATVAVLPELAAVEVDIKPEDLKIDTMRAGGPGGQKVNKTESAIRITHLPTGIVVKCQDEKSQHKNKARALRILEARIYERMRMERDRERAADRKSQIGSGDRSERIRTYNFPQDRITDHRLSVNFHGLPGVMQGALDPLLDALKKQEREDKLRDLKLEDLEEPT